MKHCEALLSSWKTTGKYPNAWISTWEEVVDVYTMTCEEEKNNDNITNAVFQIKTDDDVKWAKGIELDSWREQGVYEEVDGKGQSCITTKWVLKTKVINGQ